MLFKKRQQVSICIVAGLLVADFVLFGYMPSYQRFKEVEEGRAEQTHAIARASAESRKLPVIREKLLKLRKATENYEVDVPDQRELGVFLHKIADLMDEQNLKEQVVTPGKEVKADDLNCIPVDMRCKGGLKQIFEFFKSLQGLDRLVRIEQVKLMNDRDFSGEVSMQTNAIIYYRAKAGKG
jgi:Tfp pilus assembly protein PilO